MAVLFEMEAELRRLRLWEKQKPTTSALASTLPFCADTLRIEQWLQWVFIPQIRAIIHQQASLPSKCEIYPYALEFFQEDDVYTRSLLQLIQQIDRVINHA